MDNRLRIKDVTCIGAVTGADAPVPTTERFGIHATDLGIVWDGGDGRVFVLFGDTFGSSWGGEGAGPWDDQWRCNTLAFSQNHDLEHGMRLDEAVVDANGFARQVIASDIGFGREQSVIPTAGIEVDGRHYVHYMSVREWRSPGRWQTNHAGIAVSEDGGQQWQKSADARWNNDDTGGGCFQLGAFVREGEHVYLFGTTNGRFGPAYLARVPAARIDNIDAYTYFDGADWAHSAAAAVPVLDGPVGELSVAFNTRVDRWLALHLDEERAEIVLHATETLTGPWEQIGSVASGQTYPGLYGGYLHPWTMDSHEICFLLSRWAPYNVFLMRCRLELVATKSD
ncbi:DUF4185 domain-containing protein [Salinisphaera aquimarina]|uniref:DUF4185 domain-containing protein n=1 Tax=Salinisphaera aquimarina TaxID=2094031 RepID=A0ABV7ENS0_9GAMM